MMKELVHLPKKEAPDCAFRDQERAEAGKKELSSRFWMHLAAQETFTGLYQLYFPQMVP